MRRWVVIILLLVYPLQVALAAADRCCVTTPAGLTHHSLGQAGAIAAEPMFVADDNPALADPHCAACVFGHVLYLPSDFIVLVAERHHASAIAFQPPFLTAPPVARLERPKWPAAAS